MQEKTLIRLSLVTSFLGVLGLFILSFFVKYELMAIADIDETAIGKTVRVQGEVISIRQSSQGEIMELQDETASILIILFTKDQYLGKNTELEVLGTVAMYNCALEIKAEKIYLIDSEKNE